MGICRRESKKLWWLLGLCDQFFSFLIKKNTSILPALINDMLSNRDPIVSSINKAHPDDSDDEQQEDVFLDEFGIAMYQEGCPETLIAENMIYCLIMRYFSDTFKLYLGILVVYVRETNRNRHSKSGDVYYPWFPNTDVV